LLQIEYWTVQFDNAGRARRPGSTEEEDDAGTHRGHVRVAGRLRFTGYPETSLTLTSTTVLDSRLVVCEYRPDTPA
jgi:hypothetical protein